MKIYIIIAINIIGILQGCTDQSCCEIYDTGIRIFVENSAGQNLLDNSVSGHINTDLLQLSYIIDGKARSVYEGNLDCPTKICLIEDQEMKYLSLFPNDTEKEAFPLTILHWNDTDADTLKCSFERTRNSVICKEVWFNNIQMYPDEAMQGFERAFTIVK